MGLVHGSVAFCVGLKMQLHDSSFDIQVNLQCRTPNIELRSTIRCGSLALQHYPTRSARIRTTTETQRQQRLHQQSGWRMYALHCGEPLRGIRFEVSCRNSHIGKTQLQGAEERSQDLRWCVNSASRDYRNEGMCSPWSDSFNSGNKLLHSTFVNQYSIFT